MDERAAGTGSAVGKGAKSLTSFTAGARTRLDTSDGRVRVTLLEPAVTAV